MSTEENEEEVSEDEDSKEYDELEESESEDDDAVEVGSGELEIMDDQLEESETTEEDEVHEAIDDKFDQDAENTGAGADGRPGTKEGTKIEDPAPEVTMWDGIGPEDSIGREECEKTDVDEDATS